MIRVRRLQAYRQALKDRGITLYRLAKILFIGYDRVRHYFSGHWSRTSKRDRKLIRRWLIDQGIIVVKPRPRCSCPHCGKVHVMSMPFRCKKEAA